MLRDMMKLSRRLLPVVAGLTLACSLTAGTAAAVEAKRLELELGSSRIPPDLARDFGRVLQGQPALLVIKVRNVGDAELTIGAVRPLCTCMTEESDRAIAPGQVGTITLRLETDAYSGPTTEAALIQWPDNPVGVTRVEMKLDVQPVLEVKPSALVRFRVLQGQTASQQITLTAPDGAPFVVTSAECNSPHLGTDLVPLDGGGYRFDITLKASAPVGMLREIVLLHTDLASLPSLEIKVTGVVKQGR